MTQGLIPKKHTTSLTIIEASESIREQKGVRALTVSVSYFPRFVYLS